MQHSAILQVEKPPLRAQIRPAFLGICAILAACFCFARAAHAGGAYVVDDAAIGEVGECQVESWISTASNGDLVGLSQPACVVRIGIPIEITTTAQATRITSDWAALTGVQGKFIVAESNNMAVAIVLGTMIDVTRGESTAFVNVPVTFKIRDDVRLNLNSGWLHDTIDDTNHLTWGSSLEWDFHKQWTAVAEIFGQTGPLDKPRVQAGLRYAPTKSIDVDLIYGYNLTGENANWLTAGLTVRF